MIYQKIVSNIVGQDIETESYQFFTFQENDLENIISSSIVRNQRILVTLENFFDFNLINEIFADDLQISKLPNVDFISDLNSILQKN